jgi:capsular polysaccharide biosynthesis protein
MEERMYEDEISLKELIMVLINHWKMIVGITLIAAILGGIYGFVIANPSFESRMEGTISIPESVNTKYGSYPYPSTNTMDYLSVIKSNRVLSQTIKALDLDTSIESLGDRITINNGEESSLFSFVVTAASPEEAQELVETLTTYFIEELNVVYKAKAIDYFSRQYFVEYQSYEETEIRLQRDLENTENLIETVEPTITLRRLILNDPVYAASVAAERNISLDDLSEETMLEEVINPQYESLQGKLISLKQQLDDLQLARERNERYLAELEAEEMKLLTYRSEGDETVLTDGLLEVIQSRILVNGRGSFPENPIAPRKMLILAIAIVLGGMIGVFIAFFKAYWNNEM